MPRIVPLQLLKCLRVLLDTNGGILSATEVKRIAGLMTKYSKKLVSKCVYVQILKSTKTELLGDFMTVGGWALVCTWLGDAIRTMNWPLVQEILELLLLSPVDVNRLRINAAPILVKGLCKDGGNEGVRILAKRLVEQWLKIVTENPAGTSAANTTASAVETPQASKDSSGAELKDSNMENSSSDSTDSGGAGAVTQNYRIVSAERKRAIVLTIKTVDKSSASTLVSTDTVYNDDDNSLPPSEAGSESRGTEPNANLDSSEKASLDDSYASNSKLGEDVDKKQKNARGEKSKRSEKDRDKDRKSSSSHRSSSSSHKSSSSTSSSSKSSSKGSSSSSSHRSSSSSSDKNRDKDKARSSSSSSKEKDRKEGGSSSSGKNKSKSSSSSSSSNSSSSSSSSTSKDRSRDKDKEKSTTTTVAKKDNEKDNKLMPPPTASLSDKKPKEGEADVQKPKSISIPSRKASISIEIRRDTEKASTVKTYQSKFRSHGLTEEAPPPPSRKGLKKPTSTTLPNSAAAAAPSSILSIPSGLKRPSPPPRETSAEKKPKIDMTHVSGHTERPGAAKLIAPKKIATLVETNLFSDALAASIEPKKVVKRKRLNAALSPTDKDAPLAPLKFYQDTLDELKVEDKSDDSTKENDESRTGSPGKDTDADDDDIPLKKVKEEIEQKVQKDKTAKEGADEGESQEEDDTPAEPKKPGPGCGPDGPPGVLMLHRRKGPKKKLSWQPEDKLTQIRYFEVDRSERVNVTKQSFLEMKNMERYSERDALNISRRGFDDNMEPQMEWRPLIEVDNVPDHPNGNLSKQRTVQSEREATTLRALYFSPDMIPDSPAEAELEPHFSHDIPIIPIDDLTGNPDALNDYSSLPWPEPKGYSAAAGNDMGFNDSMPPGMNTNLQPNNPFQPFGKNGYMPNSPNMLPNSKPPMPMNMPPSGPPPIWQNQMQGGPMGMPPMNGPPAGMVDMNGQMPPNFPFGSPSGMFGAPPNFNSMSYPPMMMNGPGPGPGMGPGPLPNGPMMNGPPMPNGPMGPMPNGLGPRNNNNNRKNNNLPGGGGAGGNWRSGGNNFQDNSGGNWRSAGTGTNRGGGGNINTGICKQFMRGHCHMGKACKYVHPQKKRL